MSRDVGCCIGCDIGCGIGFESGRDIASDISGDKGCNMSVDWRMNTGRVMDSKVSVKIGRDGIIDGGDYPMRTCAFDAPGRCA